MKGRIQKVRRNEDDDDIMKAIDESSLWMLVTVTATEAGAEVSVRESAATVAIDTIAMLLEQEEIYEAVQKKIAEIKLKQGKNKPPTNPNVN